MHEDARAEGIRCGYHSRRFDLAGRMTFMPGFDGVANFPSAADDLPNVPFATWANLAFASVDPAAPFDAVFAPVREALAASPLDRLVRDPARDREYAIDAHWALYVENYLEGFHIPFVHPALATTVTLDDYRVDLFDHAVLQTAYAKDGEAAFAPGSDGRRVAALYWWVFPNLMLNFYPWGLSLNHVQPLAPDRTRIVYRGYVWDASMSRAGRRRRARPRRGGGPGDRRGGAAGRVVAAVSRRALLGGARARRAPLPPAAGRRDGGCAEWNRRARVGCEREVLPAVAWR